MKPSFNCKKRNSWGKKRRPDLFGACDGFWRRSGGCSAYHLENHIFDFQVDEENANASRHEYQ